MYMYLWIVGNVFESLLCYKFVTNLPSFISMTYKFCAIFGFHRFIEKSHEFHAMVNMNDVFTYLIS